eukprot:6196135-Pleurochrysis_carterae.AAC.1
MMNLSLMISNRRVALKSAKQAEVKSSPYKCQNRYESLLDFDLAVTAAALPTAQAAQALSLSALGDEQLSATLRKKRQHALWILLYIQIGRSVQQHACASAQHPRPLSCARAAQQSKRPLQLVQANSYLTDKSEGHACPNKSLKG